MLPDSSACSARVDGFDIAREPAEVRRRIGYVPQLLWADGALTGYENLRLSAKLYGLPRSQRSARIADALGFMGIGQVLTMPLFFASNAIYPLDLMPPWLRFIAQANPLTYSAPARRARSL